MSITTSPYVRKTFGVDAIQVTAENMQDVANWCGGTIAKTLDDHGKLYIHVPVENPHHRRQTRAFIGDWVLSSCDKFKVYGRKAFPGVFEPVATDQSKLALARDMIKHAMLTETSPSDVDAIAEKTARYIAEMFR